MKRDFPLPGDLIRVQTSEWYALGNGELLRVCEQPGWATVGREIFVAPRNQVQTFWGPHEGPPDGVKPVRMSTSGGPFRTVDLSSLSVLEFVEEKQDEFWHWKYLPKAAGGVNYQREVVLWTLSHFPDTDWADPENQTRYVPAGTPPPSIRLACVYCDRQDGDGISAIPEHWTDVSFVQSYEESCRPIPVDEPQGGSPWEWYTHLGLCPECRHNYGDESGKGGEA